MDQRLLQVGQGKDLRFARVSLTFEPELRADVFALKNNKTVAQTLTHPRYAGLLSVNPPEHQTALHSPLGDFLARMKAEGDLTYRRFLNKHGDLEYRTFQTADPRYLGSMGVYAYFVGDDLKYVGRCKDSMKKRINNGYGKIHPKNCYLDGQSTNCHLNALIAPLRESVSLWLCVLKADEVNAIELELIAQYRPAWNVMHP